MFTKISDFAREWEEELKLTEKVMEALTDDSLSREIILGRRTLGDIAWHLVLSPHYMTGCSLVFEGPAGGNEVPSSAATIAAEYGKISRALLEAVKTQWSDESLLETVDMMGESWKNGATLRFTVMHQAHHRGQMTVLMRQAGLRIPEVYGQTYESWVDAGMEPLK